MQQHTFATYDDYVAAQRELTLRKIERPDLRCFMQPAVAGAIAEDWHKNAGMPVSLVGCCHGVRRGEELDLLAVRFDVGAGWYFIGTEITPELCDDGRIICADFQHPLPNRWPQFDLIYSNSFDHASRPDATAALWVSQLSLTGLLYVEWTPWHNRLGGEWKKADCLAASLDEYIAIFSKAGIVHRVLVVPEDGWQRCILVIGRGCE